MGKKTIVIPEDSVGLHSPWRQQLIDQGYELISGSGSVDPAYLQQLVAPADAILARATAKYTPETLALAKDLKIIARMGVGFDNIDVPYCTSKGIYVTTTPTANYRSVAEHAVGLMIACSHRFVCLHEAGKQGNWAIRNTLETHTLFGKTVGIIGLGRIGYKTACICEKGLDMKVIAYDPYASCPAGLDTLRMVDSIDQVLEEADVVSLHLPYTPEMHDLIDERALNRMKDSAILINTARGGLVDEEALYRALVEGRIAGAGLETMAEEPPKKISPLYGLDNVVITPHSSALGVETMEITCTDAVQEIRRVLSGEAPLWARNQF